MEISILLTLLLMIISLGGLFRQADKICLIHRRQVDALLCIKQDLNKGPVTWAVKLVLRGLNLLNTITMSTDQKTTQTTLIQLQNHNFRG